MKICCTIPSIEQGKPFLQYKDFPVDTWNVLLLETLRRKKLTTKWVILEIKAILCPELFVYYSLHLVKFDSKISKQNLFFWSSTQNRIVLQIAYGYISRSFGLAQVIIMAAIYM